MEAAVEGRAGEGVKSESLLAGYSSEQWPMGSDIDILGGRCKKIGAYFGFWSDCQRGE